MASTFDRRADTVLNEFENHFNRYKDEYGDPGHPNWKARYYRVMQYLDHSIRFDQNEAPVENYIEMVEVYFDEDKG